MPISDAEIRGRLLQWFHHLRHDNGGWVPISDTILAPDPIELRVLGSVCQQLADVGLISWRVLEGDHGVEAGMAKITGKGVAAVETGRSPEIDIQFSSPNSENAASPKTNVGLSKGTRAAIDSPVNSKIFIVHGHDGEARETVARFLGNIGFDPIILHEQANRGRTVIEKVEANSDVGFAVVLLTPDDLGRAKAGAELEPRARQNVLLELGYFIAKLGRDRVCALKRGEVVIPSDFAGVVWTEWDSAGAWKTALGKELEAAGYPIDWSKAVR